MEDDYIQQLVVRAVQQAYDAWAAEHPSLAAVIDRISLTQQAVESLRSSRAFRQAVEGYHSAAAEMQLLDRLTELAWPIVSAIMTG